MKKLFLLIASILMSVGFVLAQAAPALTPTAEEKKDLALAQKDAIIAQYAQQAAKQQTAAADKSFTDALAKLEDLGESVKKAHGWASDVKFDPQSLTFLTPMPEKTNPPAPAAKK